MLVNVNRWVNVSRRVGGMGVGRLICLLLSVSPTTFSHGDCCGGMAFCSRIPTDGANVNV